MRFVLLLIVALGVLYWQHPGVVRKTAVTLGLVEAPAPGGAVRLFVVEPCGPCDDAGALLKSRGVAFERVSVTDNPEGAADLEDAGGGSRFPLLVISGHRHEGFQKQELIGFVAQQLGPSVFSPLERAAMARNFDGAGHPRVVMYSTATCGYCRATREWLAQRGIPWVERDVEVDAYAAQDFQLLEGSGTPLIYVGYRRVAGFNQPALQEAVATL